MKTVSVTAAVEMIPDGATLMIGGFMGVGTPERVIDEIVKQGKRNLTVIANDTAIPGRGIGKLVSAGLIGHAVASHIGLNPEIQKQMIAGQMAVDLIPQGTPYGALIEISDGTAAPRSCWSKACSSAKRRSTNRRS